MSRWGDRTLAKNAAYLGLMNVAKLAFPLLLLPYLTRVLSRDIYGVVAYVKAAMLYAEVTLDFGFSLCGTQQVVRAEGQVGGAGRVLGDILVAKLFLALAASLALAIACLGSPILRENLTYTWLSFGVILTGIPLADFVFRGLARMEVIASRYLVMRAVATMATLLTVHGDGDLVLIPVMDGLGALAALWWVWFNLRRLGVTPSFSGWRRSVGLLKESSEFFLSGLAGTSFAALSTLVIGGALSRADVAYYSVCTQVIVAGQSLYTPVIESAYPAMLERRDPRLIGRILRLAIPGLILVCGLAYLLAPYGLRLLGGERYIPAVGLFRHLIPVLALGFPAMLLGWPCLGAIGKVRAASGTVALVVSLQLIVLLMLAHAGQLTLLGVAMVRSAAEGLLLGSRAWLCFVHRAEFSRRCG